MPGQDNDEVVVTARYLPPSLFDMGGGAYGSRPEPPPPIYAELTVWNDGGSSNQPPTDGSHQPPPDVTMENGEPLTPEALRLQARVAEIHRLLGSKVGPKEFSGKLGIKTDLDELYSNNLNLYFVITRTVSYLPGFGGGVSNKSGNSGYLSSMAIGTLNGYDKHGIKGLNYLAVHELIHTTNLATTVYNSAFKSFTDRGGVLAEFGISPELASVENAVNELARQVLIYLDLPYLDDPPHGY